MNEYSLAQLAAIYTVYKDIDNTRTVYCCTCGKPIHIETFEDCYAVFGHYFSRSQHPGLKFHPNNIFVQCPVCNMNFSSSVEAAYKQYMIYRFGKNIDEQLLQDEKQGKFRDTNEIKNYYVGEIIKLSQKFKELADIVVDNSTGEVISNSDIQESLNYIEEQWNNYSVTYKQDLDELTRLLRLEPIEYERL